MTWELFIQIICALGIVISLYFLAIWKGVTKGDSRLIPKGVCNKKMCAAVMKTDYAKVFFGIPNFAWGILFYFIVFNSMVFVYPRSVMYGLMIVSWIVVLFSFYLFWALMYKLKTHCPLCYTAHVINILIAVYYTLMFI